MDLLFISPVHQKYSACFSISYLSPSPLCPLVHFPPLYPPPPLCCLPFILCRSTADNLCGHSSAQCLASVCLSCFSFTAGFWRSFLFCSSSNHFSSELLFIHSERTKSKRFITGEICLPQPVQSQP